jgi:hypothetical protein
MNNGGAQREPTLEMKAMFGPLLFLFFYHGEFVLDSCLAFGGVGGRCERLVLKF